MAYGQGTMREKRKGYWELRVMAPDAITGTPRQISRGFRGGPRDARRALAGLVDEVTKGRSAITDGTVAHLIDRWLEHAGPDLAENTVNRYRHAADDWLLPAVGSLPVRRLRASDLDALYAKMRRAGAKPASVHKVHATIRRALNQARRWKWVGENVASDATPPKLNADEVVSPSVDDVARLLGAAATPELSMILWLAAATGGRRGELVGLRWEDLRLDEGMLTVRRSVTVSGQVKEPKTKRSKRDVALDPTTVGLLSAYRALMAEKCRTVGFEYGDDCYLFSSAMDGRKPWNPSTLTSQFATLRAGLGLDAVKLHNLRHFHATSLLDAGVPIATASRRLGHSRQSTTSDLYVHAVDSRDLEAAASIGALLTTARADLAERTLRAQGRSMQ